MRVIYNDGFGNKGAEGWYEIFENSMMIYINATNSKEDWFSNFYAFRKYDILADCKVHIGYKEYAKWLHCFIIKLATLNNLEPGDIDIVGFSMGGGIAQILGEYNDFNIFNIDGPRTTSKINNSKDTLFYNKGSLVHSIPFWFKRIENAICLNKKWSPFWKSHADFNIEEIICTIKNGN